MRNRFKISLGIIICLIFLFIILFVSTKFYVKNDTPIYKTLDTIINYNYTLQDRDNLLMKDIFGNLKSVLETEEIDYELYAEYLSELFIIDLFTLNNKDNKYDVGSIEYVFPNVLNNYILNVEDTLYKYIVDISSEQRKLLPIVNKIEKNNLEKIKYNYNNKDYDGYKILLSWDYEKDFGYPKNGEVILIKENNKLYVVSYKGVFEE